MKNIFKKSGKNKPLKKPKKSKYFALIYFNNNTFDVVRLNKGDNSFNHKKRTFYVQFKDVILHYKTGIFSNKYYLTYYYDNPIPLKLDEGVLTPLKYSNLKSDELFVMMETKVIQNTNDLSKKDLSDLLTPKNIIIGLLVVGVGLYFISTGGVT